jgi:hypothetical protein
VRGRHISIPQRMPPPYPRGAPGRERGRFSRGMTQLHSHSYSALGVNGERPRECSRERNTPPPHSPRGKSSPGDPARHESEGDNSANSSLKDERSSRHHLNAREPPALRSISIHHPRKCYAALHGFAKISHNSDHESQRFPPSAACSHSLDAPTQPPGHMTPKGSRLSPCHRSRPNPRKAKNCHLRLYATGAAQYGVQLYRDVARGFRPLSIAKVCTGIPSVGVPNTRPEDRCHDDDPPAPSRIRDEFQDGRSHRGSRSHDHSVCFGSAPIFLSNDPSRGVSHGVSRSPDRSRRGTPAHFDGRLAVSASRARGALPHSRRAFNGFSITMAKSRCD